MYEHRFGLHRKPFQPVLTESDFFESETHREIIPAILHALKSDLGVAVLTAPSGCGKTVTVEFLRRLLQADSQTVFLRGGAVRSAAALLHSLHRSLKKAGSTDESDVPENVANSIRRWDIIECLQRACDFWGPIVVLLDDAHLVEPEVFAELRALLEEEAGGRRLLRLLITGPLSLEETLAEPTMSDFAQRIRTHVFLQPLRSDESVRYLDLQISNSGGVLGKIFEPEAIERIAAAADGSPRCLGLLADECLVVCDEHASRGQQRSSADGSGSESAADAPIARVSAAVVTEALQRLQHLPYAWNASAFVEDEEDDHDEVSVAEFSSESTPSDNATSSNGVIEIGSSGDSIPLESSNSSDSSGVVEIGFQAPPREAAVVESVVESVVDSVVETFEVGQVIGDASPLPSNDDHDDAESSETDGASAGAVEVGAVDFFDRTSEYPEFESSSDTSVDDLMALGADFLAGNSVDPTVLQDADNFGDTPADTVDATGAACVDRDDEVTSSSSSLEHHLVLAGGTPSPEEDFQELDDEDVTVETASLLSGEPAETVDASLGRYFRWNPAGAWPAPAVASVMRSTPQPLQANAMPVFDRYTWCELGRSVEPELGQRERLVEVSPTPVWPPDITGVAPVFSIPIVEVDERPLELSRIRPVTADVVSPDFDIDVPLPQLDVNHPDESIDYIQRMLTEVASPDLLHSRHSDKSASEVAEDVQGNTAEWIDGQLISEFTKIGQLLDSEERIDGVCRNVGLAIAETETPVELPVDEIDSVRTERQAIDFANNETSECVEKMLLPISGGTVATPSCSDEKPNPDSSIDSATTSEGDRLSDFFPGIAEVDVNVRPTSLSEAPTSAGIVPEVDTGPTSAHRASTSDRPSGDTVLSDSDVGSSPGNVQRQIEDAKETATIGAYVGGYAPRLLHMARERVVAIVPPREMLRPAAGAESIALPVPAPLRDAVVAKKQGIQTLPRISPTCDSLGVAHEKGTPKEARQSAEPRFARLFTQLRQQQASGT
ncbi:MAG: AAA family ATPase [Fuerstiella sp.]